MPGDDLRKSNGPAGGGDDLRSAGADEGTRVVSPNAPFRPGRPVTADLDGGVTLAGRAVAGYRNMSQGLARGVFETGKAAVVEPTRLAKRGGIFRMLAATGKRISYDEAVGDNPAERTFEALGHGYREMVGARDGEDAGQATQRVTPWIAGQVSSLGRTGGHVRHPETFVEDLKEDPTGTVVEDLSNASLVLGPLGKGAGSVSRSANASATTARLSGSANAGKTALRAERLARVADVTAKTARGVERVADAPAMPWRYGLRGVKAGGRRAYTAVAASERKPGKLLRDARLDPASREVRRELDRAGDEFGAVTDEQVAIAKRVDALLPDAEEQTAMFLVGEGEARAVAAARRAMPADAFDEFLTKRYDGQVSRRAADLAADAVDGTDPKLRERIDAALKVAEDAPGGRHERTARYVFQKPETREAQLGYDPLPEVVEAARAKVEAKIPRLAKSAEQARTRADRLAAQAATRVAQSATAAGDAASAARRRADLKPAPAALVRKGERVADATAAVDAVADAPARLRDTRRATLAGYRRTPDEAAQRRAVQERRQAARQTRDEAAARLSSIERALRRKYGDVDVDRGVILEGDARILDSRRRAVAAAQRVLDDADRDLAAMRADTDLRRGLAAQVDADLRIAEDAARRDATAAGRRLSLAETAAERAALEAKPGFARADERARIAAGGAAKAERVAGRVEARRAEATRRGADLDRLREDLQTVRWTERQLREGGHADLADRIGRRVEELRVAVREAEAAHDAAARAAAGAGGLLSKEAQLAERAAQLAERRLARAHEAAERAAKRAADSLAAAPARLRPVLQVNRQVVKELTAIENDLRRQGLHDAADQVSKEADGLPTTLAALRDAGVDAPHFHHRFDPKGDPVSTSTTTLPQDRKLSEERVRLGDPRYIRTARAETRAIIDQARLVVARESAKRIAAMPWATRLGEGPLDGARNLDEAAERGYVPWDPRVPPGFETKVRPLDDLDVALGITPETVFVPRQIVDGFKKHFTDPAVNEALRVLVDIPTRIWKMTVLALTPGWNVANAVGGAFLATVAGGVDPGTLVRHMAKAIESYRTSGPGYVDNVRSHREAGASTTTALRAARSSRQFDQVPRRLLVSGPAHEAFDFLQDEGRLPTTKLGRYAKAAISPAVGLARLGYRANETVDNIFRSAVYTAKVESGLPPEVALRESINAMGDFTRLTPFERHAVRRAVPFYGWMRHQVQLAFRLPIEHPLRWSLLLHLDQIIRDDEELLLAQGPEYLHGAIPVGDRYLSTSSLNPFSGIGGPALEPTDSGRILNPFIKLALANVPGSPYRGIDPADGEEFSRPPGTGRVNLNTGRPLPTSPSIARQLVGLTPQTRLARTLSGHDNIARYDDGSPVVREGRFIPRDAGTAQAVGRFVGIPTYEEKQVQDLVAARLRNRERAVDDASRYDERVERAERNAATVRELEAELARRRATDKRRPRLRPTAP